MKLEEYQQEQQKISRSLIAILMRILSPFQKRKLSPQDWDSLLHAMFPAVEDHRRQSAELGRKFYDSERTEHVGSVHNVDLEPYEFQWFAEAMNPVKSKMMQADTDESSLSAASLRAVKEVENGGRRTMMTAIRTDRSAKWWARVPYKETCAFCLMLCSRGAVYHSAETAGMKTDDTTAMQLVGSDAQEAMDKLMRRFHPGCDCKIVPVFNRKSWPGRAESQRLRKLWNEETKGYSGKDALNALRRALYEGQVDENNLAAA